MRIPYETAVEMSEAEAEGYLEAWLELNGGKRKKTYRVRRPHKG